MATGLYTYADAAVICGEPSSHPASPTHVTNPTVVVEVLSPSTEGYDRGEKRAHYQAIASLREYVLVAQDARRIEVFARDAAGSWEGRVYGPDDDVALPSLGVTLSVRAVYDEAGVR